MAVPSSPVYGIAAQSQESNAAEDAVVKRTGGHAMSKSRKDQRRHRKKVAGSRKGKQEHEKRNRRRNR